jgi:CheY-like chemotaxis protein
VRQVLVNLLGNALKFPERGSITLRARLVTGDAGAPAIAFAVEDTGIGIAAGRLAAIFDPFTQADGSTSRRFGGTGLGLTISARLVELMGGRISVDSVEGRGSTFHVVVPVDVLGDASDVAPRELAGVRVLVVDDSAPACEALAALATRMGAVVSMAPSAADAVRALQSAQSGGDPFDLVLMDFQMPERNGLDALHDARRRRVTLPPAVLVLASAELSIVAVHPHADAARVLLHKPVRRDDLVQAVRAATEETPAATSEVSASEGGETPRSAGLRVLLVEDNAVNQMVAESILERRGFEVVVARNGREGVEAFRHQRFDVVLMDIQMPEMDGFEALAAIRALEQSSGRRTPVVALTAHAMKEDRDRCLAAGMDDYLSKPIDAARLFDVIRSVLDGPLTPA